mmetsp:Transcript_162146/g.519992  ORF Transcript_162146/g.519992 Transcript_162146/m.519992 type:complete len:236 (+) Transcript_162146:88-795(+)
MLCVGKACVSARGSGGISDRSGPTPVMLHIYNASQSGVIHGLNTILKPFGAGAFHSGVEVYDLEWSYSDTSDWEDSEVTGVFYSKPRQCEGHTYCQAVALGTTLVAELDVLRIVENLERRWRGDRYHVLEHNCCHFCAELCHLLGVRGLPGWVTNLASGLSVIHRGLFNPRWTCCAVQVVPSTRGLASKTCCEYDSSTEVELIDMHAAIGETDFQSPVVSPRMTPRTRAKVIQRL